jgi:hypothetical protein
MQLLDALSASGTHLQHRPGEPLGIERLGEHRGEQLMEYAGHGDSSPAVVQISRISFGSNNGDESTQAAPCRKNQTSVRSVGAAGFEPAISTPQKLRDDQASLRPVTGEFSRAVDRLAPQAIQPCVQPCSK